MSTATEQDTQQIQQALAVALEGTCDFSPAARALYASDASNYRQIPMGVVYPASSDDVVSTVRQCQNFNIPVLMRGGGTSQNGQCVNEAIVLDCSQHLNKVLSIDIEQRTALIEPGVVCDQLKAAAEKHGLTFGPDPATHSRCTLGGMIGNNSCGPHSMLAGKTVENVLELEVLTSDGARFWVGPTSDQELDNILAKEDTQSRIYRNLIALRDKYASDIRARYPDIKRRVSGYNLDQLLPENGFNVARALVGSEGTCVSILRARVRLIANPEQTQLVVLGFQDIYTAGDSVPEIKPFKPIAMEGIDWAIVGGLNDRALLQADVSRLPAGKAWLLVELAADSTEELNNLSERFISAMHTSARVHSVLPVYTELEENALWRIREQGASATSMSLHAEDPDPIVGWEDTAVDPMQLGDYLRAFHALVDRYGYSTSLYGHFGDGCIHARITFDTRTSEGIKQFRAFSKEIAELVVKFGGSLSGEHGDGQAKAEFLPIMFGDELVSAFEQFKKIWDPGTRMNPRKVVNPYRMDENLRFSPEYEQPVVETTLSFTEDIDGFGRSTERCIGMGKCRAASGAMCPSYQATNEERYSTRGRAHLLHEMVRGEIIEDGWNNNDILESLEHCLSCKACKTACPTQVDIAAYKAEFMHQHFKNNRRPVSHYILGYMGTLLPNLSRFSRLSNFIQQGLIARGINKVLGLDAGSELPKLAIHSFKHWLKANHSRDDMAFYWVGDQHNPQVVLWADSVNSHYRPEILVHAVSTLNKAGFVVGIAKSTFCCGRPLYEYGFLERGSHQLGQILNRFYTALPEHSNVIVLEPSCLSVFKNELAKLYPNDSNAKDLAKRTMALSSFLDSHSIKPKRQLPNAILHLHCHDKAQIEASADRSWLNQCFENVNEPEQSCCGMAGTYGMAEKTRHIGQKLFSGRLKPAIEKAEDTTVIVSNGFSCASQIKQNTGRNVKHPVEIMDECL